MNRIGNEIIKSIYQGKWLNIIYKNSENEITNFWIEILSIDLTRKTFEVHAFNISKSINTTKLYIKYDNILSARVVDSSYHTKNVKLIKAIENSRDSYQFLFENSANLKVLNYLQECYALNITPIKSKYVLTQYIDEDTIKEIKEYKLSQNQFESFSKAFQYNFEKVIGHGHQVILGLNILSIKDSKGLYVLAYKELYLDVKAKTLVPSNEVKVNKEFIDGVEKYSLDRCLLEDE